jgi:dihydroneopterin triphosphate diphosphatase
MPEIVSNMVQVHPFRVRGGVVEYLLLRRSSEETYGPGVWQVITGGIEPDERSIDAARRELYEETGLVSEQWFALPTVASFYFEPTDQLILSPIFGCMLPADAEPKLSAEHCEHCWHELDQACRILIYPTHLQGKREVEAYIREHLL